MEGREEKGRGRRRKGRETGEGMVFGREGRGGMALLFKFQNTPLIVITITTLHTKI